MDAQAGAIARGRAFGLHLRTAVYSFFVSKFLYSSHDVIRMEYYHVLVRDKSDNGFYEINMNRQDAEDTVQAYSTDTPFHVKGRMFTRNSISEFYVTKTMTELEVEPFRGQVITPIPVEATAEFFRNVKLPEEWHAAMAGEVVTRELIRVVSQENEPRHKGDGFSASITGNGNVLNFGDNSAITNDSYNSVISAVKNEVELPKQEEVLRMLQEIKSALEAKDAAKASSWFNKLKRYSTKAAEIVTPWFSALTSAMHGL